MREMVGGCCVCSDDRGWSENPLVYCDGQSCTVAVHQACYGIVTVPTGPWYCRKCESQERSVKVKCELCPSKYGALKRTDNQGWAHVVCALYIPEVRFGNVTTMEPIQLQLIPAERFNKLCYICEEKGKPANANVGACMQCNRAGCKQQFHVTCAQSLGLLCEEAGNYLDNVKYCGYCQHHYSKLKKGGNVKTIPPYKPVSNEAHNSDSEKEPEAANSKNSPPVSSTKKRSSVSGKNAPNKTASRSNSGSASQKAVHNNTKGADKAKAGSKSSAKSEDPPSAPAGTVENSPATDKKSPPDSPAPAPEKDTSKSKKRKTNSRTPTPVSASVVPPAPLASAPAASEVSVVVTAASAAVVTASTTVPSSVVVASSDKKSAITDSGSDKAKKPKLDTTQTILSNQPVVALTSITSSVKAVSPTSSADVVASAENPPTSTTVSPPQTQSLVVSVPLSSAHLSPHQSALGAPVLVVNGQTSGSTLLGGAGQQSLLEKGTTSAAPSERTTPVITDLMTGNNSNQGLLTSEMSGGGLKITYEKQVDSINTEEDMELELDTTPAITTDVPARRGRSQSQSNDNKQAQANAGAGGSLAVGRGKKRSTSSTSNSAPPPAANNGAIPKRSSRSRPSGSPPPPPPQDPPPGAFAAVTQMKESPPSSPSSESQQSAPTTVGRGRPRGRKSGGNGAVPQMPGTPPSTITGNGTREEEDSPPSMDKKEIKVFQNGLTAPHMLGNQLNPTSTMHSKMTDHLNSELEAHSIFNPNENNSTLVGPQLHHRVLQSARASSTTSSTASGGSGLSSMLGGSGGTIPQTLDQLLERQWEQGSQFLMEQAQHFDIASLLSCLHQLRAENLRLEGHVSCLLQRRDHLLAVNARLAIPLTGQPAASQSNHPHTVNNIHPSVASSHGDLSRSRHSTGSSSYPSHTQSSQHVPLENGLPPDAYTQSSHRSPAGGQPSPTVRHHSPAGAYGSSGNGSNSGNGVLSQPHRPDSSGRHAPRPQPYPLYDTRPGPSSSTSTSQQMVIRRDRSERDADLHHHSSSKTS